MLPNAMFGLGHRALPSLYRIAGSRPRASVVAAAGLAERRPARAVRRSVAQQERLRLVVARSGKALREAGVAQVRDVVAPPQASHHLGRQLAGRDGGLV